MRQDSRPYSAFNVRNLKPSKSGSISTLARPITAASIGNSSKNASNQGEFSIPDKMAQNWTSVKAAKDKEGLFEEQVQLSNELSKLREENSFLRERQKAIEDEAQKVIDYILKIEAFVVKRKGPKMQEHQQSWLVVNLKKKLTEQREAIDRKQAEVDINKKDAKYLKRQEFDIAVKIYKESLEDIKNAQDKLMLCAEQQQQQQQQQQSQQQRYQTNNHGYVNNHNPMKQPGDEEEEMGLEEFERLSPRSMRKNVMQLRTNLMLLSEENDKLSVQRDGLSKDGEIKYRKLIELQEQEDADIAEYAALNSQLQQYNYLQDHSNSTINEDQQGQFEKDDHFSNQSSSGKATKVVRIATAGENSKSYSEQIKEYQTNERNQIYLQHQKEQIELQAAQIAQLSQLLQDLRTKDAEDRLKIAEETKKMENELRSLRERNESSLKEEGELAAQLLSLQVPLFPSGMKEHFTITNNILQKHEPAKVAKVPKIESVEVARIAKEINFRLRLKRIPMDYAVGKLIIPQVKRMGFVSLEYLIKKLRLDPFNVPKKEEALALGRFIVEDNSENMVEVSLAKRCHYKVARSVFKSLVGRIKIYSTDEEEKVIWQKCNDELEKNIGGLKQYGEACFWRKNIETSYIVNYEQLSESLLYVSSDFDTEKLEYIMVRLFEQTNDVQKLPFLKIFEIFKNDAWKDFHMRTSNSLIFKPGQVSYILDQQQFELTESDEEQYPTHNLHHDGQPAGNSNGQYSNPPSNNHSKTQFPTVNSASPAHVRQENRNNTVLSNKIALPQQQQPRKNTIKFNLSPSQQASQQFK